MKAALSLAIVLASAVWADEASDRRAVEGTIAALSSPLTSRQVFTADFPNAEELQRLRDSVTPLPTLTISREPMGEASWLPGLPPRFVTRSIAFVEPDTAVVVATYERQSVVFVVKKQDSAWRIASFRILPEASGKA